MHCHTGLKVIKQLCSRIKIPNEYRDTALVVCEHHTNIHRAEELRANTKLKILNKLDVWRKPERLKQLLICCEADHRGRLGLEDNPYPQTSIFNQAYQAALRADVQDVIRDGFTGKNIREELDRRRLNFIKEI